MKLTVIGGASVRTPRFIPSLVKRAQRLGLEELWLMDIDAHKLNCWAICPYKWQKNKTQPSR